jgi:hypothetical protein
MEDLLKYVLFNLKLYLLSFFHVQYLVSMIKGHVALQTSGRVRFRLLGFGSFDSQTLLAPGAFHLDSMIQRCVPFLIDSQNPQ